MNTFKQQVIDGSHQGTPLKDLGLRGRGVVHVHESDLIQMIDRSSRVLRKDAERFLEVLNTAQDVEGRKLKGHLLVRRAPICSKARAWLEERDVRVEQV